MDENFLKRLSHELRGPVANLIGLARLLESERPGPLSDRQREVVDLVSEWSDDLETRIIGVVRYLEVSARPPDHAVSSLQEAAARVVERFATNDVDVSVVLRIGEDGLVRGSCALVEEVIAIVVDNAVRFATRRVEVGVEGPRLRVRDDGPGFPSIEQARTAFALVHTRSDGRRTGLGLATAVMLCESADAHLSLANDGGAVVTVDFTRAT